MSAREALLFSIVPVLSWLGRRRRRRGERLLFLLPLVIAGTVFLPSFALGAMGTGGEWRAVGGPQAAVSGPATAAGGARDSTVRRWQVTDVEVVAEKKRSIVTGRVFVTGASFLRLGTFRITVSKKLRARGKLYDRFGKVVAVVQGNVTREGFEGRFVASATGEKGEFSWRAPGGAATVSAATAALLAEP